MDIIDRSEIYSIILNVVSSINSRKKLIVARGNVLKLFNGGFKKIAFDTRRINQGLQINPRRGLQNYCRSEGFISQGLSNKLNNLNILRDVLKEIEDENSNKAAWQDSNARTLLSHLNNALRININDNDFTETQQGVGSIDYIEELLYVRYRLALSDLNKINHNEIKKILLSKDNDLNNISAINNNHLISTGDVGKMSYDQLLNTLFAGVKATKDSPTVKRKITIEIEDSI